MTTAIIHGDPGSYKTSALVSDFLVPAIQQGRVVVTNIRGVKTCEEIAEIYGFDLLDTAEIILVSFDAMGFERMARFFHWVPVGALILMDEGQRIYPTRLRDFSQYDLLNAEDKQRPACVEDAFDSHRHMNWDIYISTTNIGKVHKEIRAVAEFGYRHKNMASIFSFMKGRYKKVTHNAENSGVAISHEITSALYKIDPRCFDAYQSTSTGKTKDTESAKSVSPFFRPKVQMLLLLFICAVGFLFSRFSGDKQMPAMFTGVTSKPAGQTVIQGNVPRDQTSVDFSVSNVSSRGIVQNPFSGLTFYIVGDLAGLMLFEVVYPDGSFLTFNEFELEQLGFVVSKLSIRVAKVTFDNDVVFALPKPVPAYVAGTGGLMQTADKVF